MSHPGDDKWWLRPPPYWWTGKNLAPDGDPLPNPMPDSPYDPDAIAFQARGIGTTRYVLVTCDGPDGPVIEVLVTPDACPAAPGPAEALVRKLRAERPELLDQWIAFDHDSCWFGKGDFLCRLLKFPPRQVIAAQQAEFAAQAAALAAENRRKDVEKEEKKALQRRSKRVTPAAKRNVRSDDAIASMGIDADLSGLFADTDHEDSDE